MRTGFIWRVEEYLYSPMIHAYINKHGDRLTDEELREIDLVHRQQNPQFIVNTQGNSLRVTNSNGIVQFHGQVQIHPTPREANMIGLDYETAGRRDLPVVGLDNYVKDPDFRVLIASIAWREHGGIRRRTFDFLHDKHAKTLLEAAIKGARRIAAHNAPFERAVSKRIKLQGAPDHMFIDTAAIARALGADGHLEKAAPGLLTGSIKMEAGKRLIKKFSLPREDGTFLVDEMLAAGTLENDDDWLLFQEYCEIDAQLSLMLAELGEQRMLHKEFDFELVTQRMNDVGWRVDIAKVEEMQRRFVENQEQTLQYFREDFDPKGELNFRSTPQLIK